MKMQSFIGGMPHTHGWDRKTQTRDLAPVVFSPQYVVVPMFQMVGPNCMPVVSAGDQVLVGQVIGQPEGPMGVPVHASVSGTVEAVEERLIDDGTRCVCVVIRSDGQDSLSPDIKPFEGERTPEAIREVMKNAGLVGMGGAMFPAHIKYAKNGCVIDHLLLNGAECEPYLTADDQMMRHHADQIACGAELMRQCCGAQKAVICIENNKPEAIAAMKKAVAAHEGMEVAVLQTRYPQGGERQLIQAVLRREVPAGKLPAHAGVVVSNVSTAAALYEALDTGMPLVRRVLTVSGGVKQPKNILAPIGTLVSDLLEFCGGLSEDADQVLLGGPMTGAALHDVRVPITRGCTGITVLQAETTPESACIRCAACVAACPAYLMPFRIDEAMIAGRLDVCDMLKATECINCGCCSYVCPAKRDLAYRINGARMTIRSQRQNGGGSK